MNFFLKRYVFCVEKAMKKAFFCIYSEGFERKFCFGYDNINALMGEKMKKQIVMSVVIVLMATMLASCGSSLVPVADITGNPDKYRHKDVQVEGVIDSIISIPIVNVRAFRLKGYNDSIWVLGKAPGTEGQQVIVRGTVDTAVSLGDRDLGTVIRLDSGD